MSSITFRRNIQFVLLSAPYSWNIGDVRNATEKDLRAAGWIPKEEAKPTSAWCSCGQPWIVLGSDCPDGTQFDTAVNDAVKVELKEVNNAAVQMRNHIADCHRFIREHIEVAPVRAKPLLDWEVK